MASSNQENDLLDLESRRTIYDRISRIPGLHLRGLQRELDMPLGTLEYHLRKMETQNILVVRNEGRRKCFFPNDQLDRRDRDILYWLRQGTPCRITMEIVEHPGIAFKELKDHVPVSPSTLSFHLKKLVLADVVSEHKDGRSKRYLVNDAERVQRLIVVYRRTFGDEVVDRFAETWLDLGI